MRALRHRPGDGAKGLFPGAVCTVTVPFPPLTTVPAEKTRLCLRSASVISHPDRSTSSGVGLVITT